MSTPSRYAASRTTHQGIDAVHLLDHEHNTEVSVAIGIGNTAYEMKVNGKNLLYFPFSSLGEFREKPTLCGVPFLAPWANRLDQMSFFANGHQYNLNQELGNLRMDPNGLPIHGLLCFTPLWELVDAGASENNAYVTSRLLFWKHPSLMAQFPFAHSIEMTYRLRNGNLNVETMIQNLASEPMPISIGYHPYFQLGDAPRDEWQVHLPVREHVVLSPQLIPTGERKPSPFGESVLLRGTQLDDVFTGLTHDQSGKTQFSMQGKSEKITVVYGPKYPVAVVYAPQGKNFLCFEPMAGLTNAMNLKQQGLYSELQSIEPDGEWHETFSIQPSGF